MKTMLLVDGDLVLGSRGYAVIEGVPKVIQDLTNATLEPVGTDRFHPGWGSILRDFIGAAPISQHLAMLIEAEIGRVIRNYAMMQNEAAEFDAINDQQQRLTMDESLVDIVNVDVTPALDHITFNVQIQTMTGDIVQLPGEVTL